MVKEREIPYTCPITIPLSCIPSKQTNATITFLPYKRMHIHIPHHHSIIPDSFDTNEYETMQTNTKRTNTKQCKRIQYCIQSVRLPLCINTNKSFVSQNSIHSFRFASIRRNHPPSLHPINTKESFAPIHPFHFSPIASHPIYLCPFLYHDSMVSHPMISHPIAS